MLHTFLPLMVETAEDGRSTVDVVNVSSIGAHTILHGASAYHTRSLRYCGWASLWWLCMQRKE